MRALDPARRVALLGDGTEMPYDLFLGVPKHVAPAVVVDAGLTVDGWIPVDPLTLETGFPDVYAIGDVTSVGTPKAGVFAEGQAAVAADRISAAITAAHPVAEYDGHGTCFIEMGGHRVARVDVTFRTGQAPSGQFDAPVGRPRRRQDGVRTESDRPVVRPGVATARAGAGRLTGRPPWSAAAVNLLLIQ